ncbi:MAG: STAS domain-containing protein [Chloroflexi bacterium]|jgi:anti-sigma B factor antagonist|nr:STAS domain-containing protein [Chloroflexota bacterium]
MQVSVSEMRRVMLIEVSGRVDSLSATKLGEALNEQIDSGRNRLVIDLSNVEYISSAGLRELVSAAKKVRSSGGDLRIAGPSHRVRDVLQLAGLLELLQVFPTQIEAVSSF